MKWSYQPNELEAIMNKVMGRVAAYALARKMRKVVPRGIFTVNGISEREDGCGYGVLVLDNGKPYLIFHAAHLKILFKYNGLDWNRMAKAAKQREEEHKRSVLREVSKKTTDISDLF